MLILASYGYHPVDSDQSVVSAVCCWPFLVPGLTLARNWLQLLHSLVFLLLQQMAIYSSSAPCGVLTTYFTVFEDKANLASLAPSCCFSNTLCVARVATWPNDACIHGQHHSLHIPLLNPDKADFSPLHVVSDLYYQAVKC